MTNEEKKSHKQKPLTLEEQLESVLTILRLQMNRLGRERIQRPEVHDTLLKYSEQICEIVMRLDELRNGKRKKEEAAAAAQPDPQFIPQVIPSFTPGRPIQPKPVPEKSSAK
jgi:hypothetical protein